MNMMNIIYAFLALIGFSFGKSTHAEHAVPHKSYVDMATIITMCQSIYKQAVDDNFQPDLIVTLARGGLTPLGFLSGETMFNNRNVRVVSVASYSDDGEQSAIVLLVPINIEDYKGFKSILILDDIADTGKSLEFIHSYLAQRLDPAVVIKTAVLFYKEKSVVKPDYFAAKTTDWIVFPWEGSRGI